MPQNRILKVFRATQKANTILAKAGIKMAKSSFDTAKEITSLYKDTGVKAFGMGKELFKKTLTLTIDNQKNLLKTSGQAVKEAVKSIRETESERKKPAAGRAKKNGRAKTKKELTIDDLL